jgi:hypothetical protein
MASIIKADTLQSTTANVFVLNSSGTEYARFDSTGNFQLANPTTFPAGTVSLPSITATGDTNTGLYFPAADTIGFVEGGVEAMRINSSGNVGIGTSSPTARLTLASGTNEGAVRVGDNATYYGELARVQATDEVRLGAYGPSQNLVFYTNASERARIDSSGNLLVGTTSSDITAVGIRLMNNNQVQASKSGDWSFRMGRRDSTGIITEIYYNSSRVGDIATNGTGTTYNSASDYRLKENIEPMTGALARVVALNPVTYKWKVNGSNGQGFIAHELQAVVPDAVRGVKDEIDANGKPVYQGVDTSYLVATLTAAIQEQQVLITQLQADVAALKAK